MPLRLDKAERSCFSLALSLFLLTDRSSARRSICFKFHNASAGFLIVPRHLWTVDRIRRVVGHGRKMGRVSLINNLELMPCTGLFSFGQSTRRGLWELRRRGGRRRRRRRGPRRRHRRRRQRRRRRRHRRRRHRRRRHCRRRRQSRRRCDGRRRRFAVCPRFVFFYAKLDLVGRKSVNCQNLFDFIYWFLLWKGVQIVTCFQYQTLLVLRIGSNRHNWMIFYLICYKVFSFQELG